MTQPKTKGAETGALHPAHREGRFLVGVADPVLGRGDLAIIIHGAGLSLTLLFDDICLLFHGFLCRTFGHGIGPTSMDSALAS